MWLAGCDAWPTVVDNQAPSPITVRYHHSAYDYWSGPISIAPDHAKMLSRAHWVQDIDGLRIAEGERLYSLSTESIRELEKTCDSTEFARRVGVARNCYLIYLGSGRLRLSSEQPEGLQYQFADDGG